MPGRPEWEGASSHRASDLRPLACSAAAGAPRPGMLAPTPRASRPHAEEEEKGGLGGQVQERRNRPGSQAWSPGETPAGVLPRLNPSAWGRESREWARSCRAAEGPAEEFGGAGVEEDSSQQQGLNGGGGPGWPLRHVLTVFAHTLHHEPTRTHTHSLSLSAETDSASQAPEVDVATRSVPCLGQ